MFPVLQMDKEGQAWVCQESGKAKLTKTQDDENSNMNFHNVKA